MPNRVEKEKEISPERILGRTFRVPAIAGEGTGGCFRVTNLHLPKEWGKVISKVQIDTPTVRKNFPQGDIVIDPTTKVLIKIAIPTDPPSRLHLAEDFSGREAGLYQMDDVRDANVAIALLMMAASLLTPFWVETGSIKRHECIPHIDGEETGYYSKDLRVQDAIYNSKRVWTNDYYQRQFAIQASNIAGRFGMSLALQGIYFNEQGLLLGVGVKPGNACCYNLGVSGTPDPQAYTGHNVDFPRQALALHGIVAEHINDMLKRVDGEYYRM